MSHGHVIPNEDGSRARCGGPGICSVCALELAQHDRPKLYTQKELDEARVDGLMEAAVICQELRLSYAATMGKGWNKELEMGASLCETRIRNRASELKESGK